MERCPKCRTKYDPSYTVACSKCGALLAGLQPSSKVSSASEGLGSDSGLEELRPKPPSGPRKVVQAYFDAGAPFLAWIIVGALGLGGLVVSSIAEADRDEGGSIVDTGAVNVLDTQVGDCLDLRDEDLDADVIYEFVGIPCAEPHGLEVYGIVTYSGVNLGDFPGDEVLEDYGSDRCVDLFDEYVGVAYSLEPSLDITYFTPEPEGWAQGDRKITCALVSVDESDLVGSMNGGGMIHSQSLQTGCYDMPDDPDVVLGLYPRSCEEAHDVEVYSVEPERLTTSAGFDETRIIEFGDRTCQEDYDLYLGAARSNPDFTWSYFYPTPESWAAADRKVICFVSRIDGGSITGSVEGGAAGADA